VSENSTGSGPATTQMGEFSAGESDSEAGRPIWAHCLVHNGWIRAALMSALASAASGCGLDAESGVPDGSRLISQRG